MQFSISSIVFAIMATAAVAEKQIQINYYSDSSCKSYQGQVDVSWATPLYGGKNNCYNYQYGNSVIMANCNKAGGCLCNFFYQKDCQGSATQQLQSNGPCIGGAQQLKSFACYYR